MAPGTMSGRMMKTSQQLDARRWAMSQRAPTKPRTNAAISSAADPGRIAARRAARTCARKKEAVQQKDRGRVFRSGLPVKDREAVHPRCAIRRRMLHGKLLPRSLRLSRQWETVRTLQKHTKRRKPLPGFLRASFPFSHRQNDAELRLAAHHPCVGFAGFLERIGLNHGAHAGQFCETQRVLSIRWYSGSPAAQRMTAEDELNRRDLYRLH